jgi:hypothetical protein
LTTPLLTILVLGLAGPGCSENKEREPADASLAIQDIPPNVMDSARNELPGVESEDAWIVRDSEGMIKGYEVRDQDNRGNT